MSKQKVELLWHIELAVLCAIFLQLFLVHQLTVGPKYVIAGLELLLLLGLRLTAQPSPSPHRLRRLTSIALTALISFANITSLIIVCRYLIGGGHAITGHKL